MLCPYIFWMRETIVDGILLIFMLIRSHLKSFYCLELQSLTLRFSQITQTLLEDTLKCLVGTVKSETAAISSVAMQAIGHIGLRVPLPPLCSNSESGNLCCLSWEFLGFVTCDYFYGLNYLTKLECSWCFDDFTWQVGQAIVGWWY